MLAQDVFKKRKGPAAHFDTFSEIGSSEFAARAKSDADMPLKNGLPVVTKDALADKHGEYEIVLANPPFGKRNA